MDRELDALCREMTRIAAAERADRAGPGPSAAWRYALAHGATVEGGGLVVRRPGRALAYLGWCDDEESWAGGDWSWLPG